MKISLVEKLMRPHKEMGAIGGIGFGFIVLAPAIFGAILGIGWLVWGGVGLFGLLVVYIIVSGLTAGRSRNGNL